MAPADGIFREAKRLALFTGAEAAGQAAVTIAPFLSTITDTPTVSLAARSGISEELTISRRPDEAEMAKSASCSVPRIATGSADAL